MENEAVEFVKTTENRLKNGDFERNCVDFLRISEINQPKTCVLRENTQYLHEIRLSDFENFKESNSAIEVFWQGGAASPRERLFFRIFDRILMDPCFDSLRTEQQLGYAVMR